MIYKIARTEEEIDQQLNLAAAAVDSGTNVPGMSYEEGVQNAILWLSGDYEDCPIDDPTVVVAGLESGAIIMEEIKG